MKTPWSVVGKLAWRNLWRNHRRTLIMLAAIAVGVWAMIFLTAVLRGMVDDMVRGGIRTLPGHVQVHHPAHHRYRVAEDHERRLGAVLLHLPRAVEHDRPVLHRQESARGREADGSKSIP